MPFLFQRSFLIGRRSVISPGTVANWLDAAAASAGLRDTDGRPITFSPHDFRRVFLTDAVRNGLPIHIAAQLADQDDLTTTRRYAATYPTEVIEHYQQFVARRRAERPVEEYREPTTRNLRNSVSTLAGGRSNSVAAYARMERAAPTNTHVCVVVSYKLTHLKPTGSPLSRRTSTPGSRPPANKSGSATLNNCSSH